MNWRKASVAVLAGTLGIAACSTDQSSLSNIPTGAARPGVQTRSAGCPSLTAMQTMITNLFPATYRGTATSQFQHAVNAFTQGNPALGQSLAAQLYAYTIQLYNAGTLTGAGTPAGAQAVAAFVNGVFCNVGMTVNLSANLSDNVVQIVPPNTTATVKTGCSSISFCCRLPEPGRKPSSRSPTRRHGWD